MNCWGKAVTIIAVGIIATASIGLAQPAPEKMSFSRARRVILTSGKYMFVPGSQVAPESIVVTRESIEFDADNRHHYRIDLKSMEPVVFGRCNGFCTLKNPSGKNFGITSDPKTTLLLYSLVTEQNLRETLLAFHSFVDALNSLHVLANSGAAEDFHRRAAAWRALPSKPPVPEEVRVQRLLAEDAVKQNKPGEALNRYETGLELYPTWPQGRFNAALVAAELGYFADAVEHMQAYLELVPDAPDAQAARDQIAMWQFKAKEKG